jgi:hypothetical protein
MKSSKFFAHRGLLRNSGNAYMASKMKLLYPKAVLEDTTNECT